MKRNTVDFDNAHYSADLIRKYEDPEYARAAAEYERQARAERAAKNRAAGGQSSQSSHSSRSSGSGYSYEDYLAARGGAHSSTASASRQQAEQRRAQSHARQPQKKHKKKRRKGCLGRLIKIIFVLLLLIVVGVAAYAMMITKNLDRIDTDDENFAINSRVAEDLSDYRNIAILGSDARKGEGYDGSRTDAIIVLSINKKTGDSKMISVMRDSYLMINGATGDLALDKVTHAHAYGGGVDTVSALNRNLDLNIEEFVIFNWKAVADTVDTLGGIEIDVKKKELKDLNHYGKETGKNVGKKYHKVKKAGVQTLDGVQATTYCRIRKTSGGDTGRAKRYKKVMAGVLKKMATHPWKAGALSRDVMPQIRTNITQKQMLTLIARVPFMKMGKSVAWPKTYWGGLVGGVWYAVPQTLSSNVKWLHKKAFEQYDYTPTKKCRQISEEISAATGVY